MKRILLFLAFAVVFTSGCVRENYSQQLYTLTASVEAADTRAKLAQESADLFRMHWEEGDRISVLPVSGTANVPFDLTTGAGTGTASFHNAGGVPAGVCFAVYPYDPSVSVSDNSVLLTYPAELVYDAAEGRVKGGEYMIAVASDGNFRFKNIHSYLDLTFTAAKDDKITTIVVEARNGAVISGPASVSFSGDAPQVRMTGSGKTVTVQMGGAPIGPDKPLNVSVPLAPAFTNGIKITLNSASGASRTFTSSVTLERNMIVEMNEAPFSRSAEASINSNEYETVEEAFADLPKYRNATVTLLRDAQCDKSLSISGSNNVTLDLAGHTLQVVSLVSTAASVTLTDSSAGGTGVLKSVRNRTLQVDAGKFAIDSGTIISRDSAAVYVVGTTSDAANVIFNGGTITSEKAVSIVKVVGNGTFDMHGGNIVSKGGYALHARSLSEGTYPTINVDGGSVTGSATHIFYAYTRAHFNISGGLFQTDNGRVIHNGTTNLGVQVKVTGGYFHVTGYPENRYFSGYNATSVGKLFVTGGYYNVDPVGQSTAAASDKPLTISAPYEVKHLDTPVAYEGFFFPYKVAREYEGILVGYSQNGTPTTTRNAFKKAFEDAGARVCYFENYVTTDAEAEAYMETVDALVIPGSATNDASNRSSSDRALIRAAISQGKPVLGVCYGHQRICLVKGGSVPSVADTYPNSSVVHKQIINGENSVRSKELHSITIDKTSTLYKLLGEETIMVNSSHNYCCKISNGKLKVVATAPDGCCEALESTTPGEVLLGVQFHPEYLYSAMGRTKFLALFKYIVDKAEEARNN